LGTHGIGAIIAAKAAGGLALPPLYPQTGARINQPSPEKNAMTTVSGIVLCGGQSQRMGRPKAWLPFGGELMLQRVVRILGGVVRPVVVVAAPEQDVPPLPASVVVVRDEERGRGPLQGLAAGLRSIASQAGAAYLSSCDVPFLQPGFVERMIELLENHTICVPRVGDYHHPLAAVYRIEVAGVVERLLAANRLRPQFLFEEVTTRVVAASELAGADPTFQSLRNLNTPEDYEAALRDAGFTRGETADPDRGA
jgi:molybdopterin-guanine dinucleotide biosynthesis protein A